VDAVRHHAKWRWAARLADRSDGTSARCLHPISRVYGLDECWGGERRRCAEHSAVRKGGHARVGGDHERRTRVSVALHTTTNLMHTIRTVEVGGCVRGLVNQAQQLGSIFVTVLVQSDGVVGIGGSRRGSRRSPYTMMPRCVGGVICRTCAH
jgi:hypothetical protein